MVLIVTRSFSLFISYLFISSLLISSMFIETSNLELFIGYYWLCYTINIFFPFIAFLFYFLKSIRFTIVKKSTGYIGYFCLFIINRIFLSFIGSSLCAINNIVFMFIIRSYISLSNLILLLVSIICRKSSGYWFILFMVLILTYFSSLSYIHYYICSFLYSLVLLIYGSWLTLSYMLYSLNRSLSFWLVGF